jgi:hypothetical protein
LPLKIPEKNVLLFAVVRSIRIRADEVNSRVNEERIDTLGSFDLCKGLFDERDHPFDQTVLYHKWSACLHFLLLDLFFCLQYI